MTAEEGKFAEGDVRETLEVYGEHSDGCEFSFFTISSRSISADSTLLVVRM